ncbi:MAG: hypothetical protein JWN34_903 [Bryobacterales bacterium]|jgi:hypothetical protein|nr:hypothetical protein [Bryobacterales bacterium]
MLAGTRMTARVEEEPCAPLRFVDPDFDETGARNGAVRIVWSCDPLCCSSALGFIVILGLWTC